MGELLFYGLDDVTSRPAEFSRTFVNLTGLSEDVAARLISLALTLQEKQSKKEPHWRFRDLLISGIPRDYQLEAYAICRGYGYRAVALEAPTGSGKTLIGMLCIEDWLSTMAPGQSILILVPTVNDQQQWVRELCYNPAGLGLAPEAVFEGSPADLGHFIRRANQLPAVMVMTYLALGKVGHDALGFHPEKIRDLLLTHGIQHAILDEVHKAAADPKSTSPHTVAELVRCLKQGPLHALIGFSGTVFAYQALLESVGLRLLYRVPMMDMVATGFVAPFAEYGVPFAYSERERELRALLDHFKECVRGFIALAGADALREAFKRIPIAERVAIGLQLLGLYSGHPDAAKRLRARIRGWEQGPEIQLPDVALISTLQIAAAAPTRTWCQKTGALNSMCFWQRRRGSVARSQGLVKQPAIAALLGAPDLGRGIDVEAIRGLESEPEAVSRHEGVRRLLAQTMVGLYEALGGLYQRMGQGRVAAVRAILQAERAERPLSAAIVFDRGRRIGLAPASSNPRLSRRGRALCRAAGGRDLDAPGRSL